MEFLFQRRWQEYGRILSHAFWEVEYWNEYLTEKGVVFLFHLQEGIRRYEVENYLNDEV